MLFVAILLAPGFARAQSETLLALSKTDHTLASVDPSNLKVLGRAPVGEDPHEVIASSDGKLAYVSNYGGGTLKTIAVIDLVNLKALTPISLGPLRGAHGLMFVGGKLWFTAEGSKAIGSYDPASQTIDWVMGTGQDRTHMIYVWPDLNHIVTSNIASATMSMIDKGTRGPRSDWEETLIPVGRGAEGFDVSPDNKEIWAANAQDGTISVIDIAGRKVVQTINADVNSANRLKFTPDGRHVFVSLLRGGDLVVLDASTRQVAKRVPIGHGAAGILMRPDGSVAYVSCGPDNYIAVVDLKSFAVTGHIQVGGNPDGLAWCIRH